MILITRPLEDALSLQKQLEAIKIESSVEPLFTMQVLPFCCASLSKGMVIVTSKNAIRALAQSDVRKDLYLCAMSDNIASFARSNNFSKVFSCGCRTAAELEKYITSNFDKCDRIIYLSGLEINRDIVSFCNGEGFKLERQICYKMNPVERLSNKIVADITTGKVEGIALLSDRAAMVCKSLLLLHGFEPNLFRYFVMSMGIASALDCGTVYVSEHPTAGALVDIIKKHYYVGRKN